MFLLQYLRAYHSIYNNAVEVHQAIHHCRWYIRLEPTYSTRRIGDEVRNALRIGCTCRRAVNDQGRIRYLFGHPSGKNRSSPLFLHPKKYLKLRTFRIAVLSNFIRKCRRKYAQYCQIVLAPIHQQPKSRGDLLSNLKFAEFQPLPVDFLECFGKRALL